MDAFEPVFDCLLSINVEQNKPLEILFRLILDRRKAKLVKKIETVAQPVFIELFSGPVRCGAQVETCNDIMKLVVSHCDLPQSEIYTTTVQTSVKKQNAVKIPGSGIGFFFPLPG